MELLDAASLISSIASLVLAVVAIALSAVFYRWSNDQATRSTQNATDIKASVERLEKLFDGLYSDTFTMMKETVTDMRQHIWHRSEAASSEAPSDTESTSPDPVLLKLHEIGRQLGIAENKIEKLSERLAPVVQETTEAASIRPPSVRSRVLRMLQFRADRGMDQVTPSELTRMLARRGGVSNVSEVIDLLFELRVTGHVTWDGDGDVLSNNTRIRYVPPAERRAREAS